MLNAISETSPVAMRMLAYVSRSWCGWNLCFARARARPSDPFGLYQEDPRGVPLRVGNTRLSLVACSCHRVSASTAGRRRATSRGLPLLGVFVKRCYRPAPKGCWFESSPGSFPIDRRRPASVRIARTTSVSLRGCSSVRGRAGQRRGQHGQRRCRAVTANVQGSRISRPRY